MIQQLTPQENYTLQQQKSTMLPFMYNGSFPQVENTYVPPNVYSYNNPMNEWLVNLGRIYSNQVTPLVYTEELDMGKNENVEKSEDLSLQNQYNFPHLNNTKPSEPPERNLVKPMQVNENLLYFDGFGDKELEADMNVLYELSLSNQFLNNDQNFLDLPNTGNQFTSDPVYTEGDELSTLLGSYPKDMINSKPDEEDIKSLRNLDEYNQQKDLNQEFLVSSYNQNDLGDSQFRSDRIDENQLIGMNTNSKKRTYQDSELEGFYEPSSAFLPFNGEITHTNNKRRKKNSN